MRLRPAARIARIAWRVLWEKPPTLSWPPKPPVHKVTLRDRQTGETITMFPNDTTALIFDPSKATRVHTWDVGCSSDPHTGPRLWPSSARASVTREIPGGRERPVW